MSKKSINFNLNKFFKKLSKIRGLRTLLILGPLFPILFFLIRFTMPSETQAWMNDDCLYRQSLTITNAGSELTDYQVPFTLDTATLIANNKMQTDCGDIRITDSSGNLRYWIEDDNPGCDDAATTIWVKMKTVPAGDSTIYIYYGNGAIDNGSNGNEVFDFFEDFEGESIANLESEGWVKNYSTDLGYASPPAYSIVDGRLYIDNNYGWGSSVWFTKDANLKNGIFRTRVNQDNYYIAIYTYIGLSFRTTANPSDPNTAPGNRWNYSFEGASTEFKHATIGTSSNGSGTYSQDAWHTIEVIGSDTDTKAYYDGSLESTLTAAATSGGMGARAYEVEGYWEYLLIREYAATEPTAGAASSEEQSPGPAAYWSFDEGYGSTVYDATNQGNNGTFGGTSAPEWQTIDLCKSGTCLLFDGTNDQISAGDLDILDTITIEAWINPQSTAPGLGIISKRTSTENQGNWTLRFDSGGTGKLEFRVWDSSSDSDDTDSTSVINTNEWTHVAVSFDDSSNETNFYINGKHDRTHNITYDLADTAENVLIGDDGQAGEYQGFIDEVKIYPYVRSAAEIKQDAMLPGTVEGSAASFGSPSTAHLNKGLVGYWKMDEASWDGSADEVIDSSGNEFHGQAVGTTEPTTATGKFGKGGEFDGIDNTVNLGNPTALQAFDTITLSAWVNTDIADSSNYIFISKDSDAYYLAITNGNVRFRSLDLSSDTTTGETTLSTDTWYHLAATYDGKTVKVYVNGEIDDTEVSSGSMSDGSNDVQIGSFTGTGNFFNGTIDEVRIYNRALSPQEIKDLYNWAPGPIIHYQLNEGSGTNPSDSSGNSNTGTLAGSSTWTSGKFGKGIWQDGNQDYLQFTQPNLNGAYTLEYWIDPDTTFAYAWNSHLIQYSWHARGVRASQFTCTRVDLEHHYSSEEYNAEWNPHDSICTDGWHHWALTYNGVDIAELFIDGISQGTQSINPPTWETTSTTNQFFSFSTDGNSSKYDDVRIYNYARTQAQIIEDMNGGIGGAPSGQVLSSNSPVGYWKFDEGYGSTANDSGFGGNNGTLGTGDSAPSWTNAGKIGKALDFDGTYDYIRTNSNAINRSDGSISMWLYVGSNPTDSQTIFLASSDSTSDGFGAATTNVDMTLGIIESDNGTYPNQFQFQNQIQGPSDSGENYNVFSGTQLTAGSWYHVVATWKTLNSVQTGKVYIDSLLKSSATCAYASPTAFLDYNNFGATFNASSQREFDGLIDEVKIYNFALTESQVKQDYNQGKSAVMGALSTDSSGNPSFSATDEYCPPGQGTGCTAPIGRWKMDENSDNSCPGGTADVCDHSGNSFHGTNTNMETSDWVPGKFGYALNFDGSNEYILYDDTGSSALDITGSFTIQSWIYFNELNATYTRLISKGSSSGTNLNYTFQTRSSPSQDEIRCQFRDTVSTWHYVDSNSADLTTDSWYQISCVHDASADTLTLYFDGIYNNSIATATGTPGTGDDDLTIGYSPRGGEYLNGLIDDVRIYNYARTQAQIAWDYNRGQPIGWWKFDKGEGTTAYDSMGNSNGTLGTGGSAPTWTTSGKRNGALDFDGTDDYVDFGSTSFISDGSPFTISSWFKMTDASGHNALLSTLINGQANGFAVDITDDQSSYLPVNFGSANAGAFTEFKSNTDFSNQFTDGDFHHLVITYNGSSSTSAASYTLYWDGISQGVTTGGTFSGPDDDNHIGHFAGSSFHFDGLIDEVKIFNYALTAQQVKLEYNQGAINF
jgi:concanavalin A-like lectin/glucanase superfamily protein/uncharacterized protein DUF2341